jgi:hypothetical protein
MSLDIASMTPPAREYLLTLGENYSTPTVMAQGDKTLQGLVKHAPVLVDFGFALKDRDRMELACAALQTCVVGRAQAAGSRKHGGKTYRTTRRKARQNRRSARNALTAAMLELLESGAEPAAQLVHTALEQTNRLDSDEQLPAQLQMLRDVLVHADVVGAVVDRGGPGIVARLDASRIDMIDALRERAGQSPVTAAVEEREIIEGLIVSLARRANTAASLAAEALGQPSIALDLALTYLNPPRSGKGAGADAPGDEP